MPEPKIEFLGATRARFRATRSRSSDLAGAGTAQYRRRDLDDAEPDRHDACGTVGAVTSLSPTRRRIDPVLLARAFRTVAIAEACSWTGLLIGMVFKYLVVFDDVGVKIFGPIHGVLFILYVVITLMTARVFRWRPGTTVVGLLASIPPLTTLWFEHSARRRGLIDGERVRQG
jgi:integral membrane protein